MKLKELNYDEMEKLIAASGEPRFRAGQIFSWIHAKNVKNISDMRNVPKKLREYLILINSGDSLLENEIIKEMVSKDNTRKYLLKLGDNSLIECVLMNYEYGLSICVSTQVGCAMACSFCASGLDGFVRNLSAAEIIEEVYTISRHIGERIGRIVFMGMGEPLLNYDNLIRAIRILCDERGLNLSPRHITISTCGIIPGILALAKENLPLTLALSLHAATQSKREAIMPISKKYPLNEVMAACRAYRKETGRRVTYEYCIQGGVNDSDNDADEIIKLLCNDDSHLNIIPIHKVKGIDSKPAKSISEFKKKLEKKGINVTIRRELGQDIDGACGQLRRKYTEGNKA